ncbi:hypothetical protein COCVIDRAFT_98566 [Bipolaris victoriae FI3]|uniref:Uncharacterized protein n=2 Tax=Bipolaris TaxID=33194 RepID=W6Y4D7_COCC2|nr:uncharacterized protein COCCADRAFT_93097 [Bipolaris zeicola 26-R-13]XP_014556857.1 hypothetical protein COCVIDRAFT_98566 [Bipolaris victoriae FI3]EUC34597.1 hypothetical protein COCCADRAFT_93097 [Bipolaris zeicola 26-R-13]
MSVSWRSGRVPTYMSTWCTTHTAPVSACDTIVGLPCMEMQVHARRAESALWPFGHGAPLPQPGAGGSCIIHVCLSGGGDAT